VHRRQPWHTVPAVHRRVDAVACWLAAHNHTRAAELLWRTFRML